MPGIPSQLLELPFGSGVAEQLDPRVVPPGSYLTLENAVFDHAGAIQKRSGYGALGETLYTGVALPPFVSLRARGSQLTAFGDNAQGAMAGVFVRAPASGSWYKTDEAAHVAVSRAQVVRGYAPATAPYVFVIGSVSYYVWFTAGLGIYYKGVDTASGAAVVDATLVLAAPNLRQFSALVLGSRIVVAAVVSTSSAVITNVVNTVNGSILSSTFGPSNPAGFVDLQAVPGSGSVGILAVTYLTSPATTTVTPFTVPASVLIGGTAATLTGGSSDAFAPTLTVTATRVYASYFTGSINGPGAAVRLAWMDLTAPGGTQTLSAPSGAASAGTVNVPVGSTTPAVVVLDAGGAPLLVYSDNYVTTMARYVSGSNTFQTPLQKTYWATLVSRPFVQDGRAYVAVATPDAPNTYVLVCLDEDAPASGVVYPARLSAVLCRARGTLLSGTLPQPLRLDSKRVALPLPVLGNGFTTRSANSGVDVFTLDFNAITYAQAHMADAAGLTVVSGGHAGLFDGNTYAESGFVHPPAPTQVPSVTVQASGIANGVYGYAFVYEWTDDAGNRHQSEPAFTTLDTTGRTAGTYAHAFSLRALSLTNRGWPPQGDGRAVTLAAYRTQAASTGPYYRITPLQQSFGALTSTTSTGAAQQTVAFTDSTTDAQLAALGYGTLYTDGGVLPNVAPPAASYVCAHKGRVWLVNAEDPKELWYSRPLAAGEPPNFSDAQTFRLDEIAGGIIALASLDEKLAIFTTTRIYLLAGDGPTDTGQGGSFAGPYMVTTDGGCDDPRSVITCDEGVYFRSGGALSLLTRKLTVEYVGAPVRDTFATYSQVRGVLLDLARTRLVWHLASGPSNCFAVFDYDKNVWSTWRVGAVGDVTAQALWQGKHLLASATPALCYEAYGAQPAYDPGGSWVTLTIDTPWIKPGGLAGYQRVRKVHVTGRYLAYHTLSVSVFHDYVETATQTTSFDVGPTTPVLGGPAERLSVSVVRQKCSALRVRIQDSPSAAAASGNVSGASFAGLTFEIAALPNAARLPAVNRA